MTIELAANETAVRIADGWQIFDREDQTEPVRVVKDGE